MVIRFDLSVLPSNADIKKAVLSLYFSGGSEGDSLTVAHRLIKEWNEHTVTWMQADTGAPWDLVGGDYTLEDSAQTTFANDSTWENYDVTGIVKKFIDGTPNYGFIVVPDLAEGNTSRDYYSTAFEDIDSLKPKLTVTYTSNAISTPNKSRYLLQGVLLYKDGSVIRLFVPFEKQYRITIYNSKGRVIENINGCESRWYRLNAKMSSHGIYFSG